MKIRGVRIGLSSLHLVVVLFFVWLLVHCSFVTRDVTYLVWGLPITLILLIIPIINSYSVGSQYEKLLPEYEAQSRNLRIKQIGPAQLGKPIRIKGVVQSVKGLFLCRPTLTIFDGSASIVVQRSSPFDFEILIGDSVEVVGMVTRRFNIFGNTVIHAIGLKKTEDFISLGLDESGEKIRIKKY
jgi:hypothetical protein